VVKKMSKEIKICPRCGEPYSWIEKRRVVRVVGGRRCEYEYFYAVHEYREGGKRKIKKCYLGPDAYKYVSLTHKPREGLTFSGLMDSDRAIKYFYSLMSYIERAADEIDPKQLRALAKNAREFADRIEKIAEKIEKQEKEEREEQTP